MIYIFGNPENSLGVHLYSVHNTSDTKMKVIKNRAPGISFEILTDKKSGLKIVGLSNVVNFLAGNMPNNQDHDFYCWLTTQFNVTNPLHQNTVLTRIGETEIVDFFVFGKLHYAQKAGFEVPESLSELFTTFSEKYAKDVEKFVQMNNVKLKVKKDKKKGGKKQ
jgi:hypothetical protein